MSFLEDILEKLGLPKTPVEEGDGLIDPDRPRDAPRRGKHRLMKPGAISKKDVVKKLEELSGGNDNWKVSIVELLNLLNIDSSLEARKKMAVELGCPPQLMDDSAQMNTWLHKKVLKRIARHGGNVPQNLLD